MGIMGVTCYTSFALSKKMTDLQETHEARMDELEGTLRGHIGYIEEALDRLEGKATEKDRGKKIQEYYGTRARDEKR